MIDDEPRPTKRRRATKRAIASPQVVEPLEEEVAFPSPVMTDDLPLADPAPSAVVPSRSRRRRSSDDENLVRPS